VAVVIQIRDGAKRTALLPLHLIAVELEEQRLPPERSSPQSESEGGE
jgi:hypothetical protein